MEESLERDKTGQLYLAGQPLYHGSILSPAGYRLLLERLGKPTHLDRYGGYAVVIGVSDAMWTGLHAKQRVTHSRITAFPSPSGRMMLTLVLQVGTCQLRVLLDLEVEMTRRALLASRSPGFIRLMLAAPRGDSAGLVFDFRLPDGTVDSVLSLPVGQGNTGNLHDRLNDAAFVTVHLMENPDALAIEGQPLPDDISVTEAVTCAQKFEVNQIQKHLH